MRRREVDLESETETMKDKKEDDRREKDDEMMRRRESVFQSHSVETCLPSSAMTT